MTTYNEVINYMDDNFPFYNTLILNMGKPKIDKSVPTLCVRFSPSEVEGYELAYNDDYLNAQTVEQGAGALLHEALHAILLHLVEIHETTYEDQHALTIAHELIVNDRIVNEGFSLPDGLYYGPEIIGQDTSAFSTFEVYEMVVEAKKKTKEEMKEVLDQIFDKVQGGGGSGSSDSESSEGSNDSEGSNGSKGDDDCESSESDSGSSNGNSDDDSLFSGTVLCSHDHSSVSIPENVLQDMIDAMENAAQNASSEDKENVSDEMLDALNASDSIVSKSSMAGTGGRETVEETSKKMNVSVEWVKLLAEINPDILQKKGKMAARQRSDWRAPRRNLAHMYPQVMVPNKIKRGEPDKLERNGDNKPYIVLALDLSGSIPVSMTKTLVQLAKNIPTDLIDVDVCTFSTIAVPFDVHSDSNSLASGGTDFSCIGKFVQDVQKKRKRKKYPNSVIVITDGEADFYQGYRPSPAQLKDNWTWLLIHRNDYMYARVDKSTVKRLSDYMN